MWARDRRRRRRSLAPFILVGVAGALVLGLLIDGLAHVGTASSGYRQTVTRSYTLATRPLAWSSNQTGRELVTLVRAMRSGRVCSGPAASASTCRRLLQQQLDALVADSAATAQASSTLVPPAPPGPSSGELSSAFDDRAQAVRQVRGAVDGLLGMAPLPVVGAPAQPAQSSRAARTANLVEANQAANQLIGAAGLLRRADRRYAGGAAQLRRQPGGLRLPASNWVGRGRFWSVSYLQALVDQLDAIPSLQPFHRLVILPQAVDLVPGAVPSVSGTPTGAVLIPPTPVLQVSLVVSNQGNVAEPDQRVSVQLVPAGGGHPTGASQKVSVAAQASKTVVFGHLVVSPGTQYTLNLAVSVPPGQADPSFTSYSIVLQVAPATPTTTAARAG